VEGKPQRWDAETPLAACCAAMQARIRPVDELARAFPWAGTGPAKVADRPPRAGFSFSAWDGNLVVSSWEYARDHLLVGHGPAAWSDFLHAAASPCIVLDQSPRRPERPRVALYRLRPGLSDTFRLAILERLGKGRFRLVTAFAKQSLAGDHLAAIPSRVGSTCTAFCLRRRDVDPKGGRPPARWSVGAITAPPGCCELAPGCRGE
jgi:hypothetical protein